MENLNSEDWCSKLKVEIIDPDGWDRANFNKSWLEKITKQEFLNRVRSSTVSLQNIGVLLETKK